MSDLDIKVEIHGLDETIRAFDTLTTKVQKNITKSAIMQSSQPMLKRTVSLLSRMTVTRTGNLIRSMGRVEKSKKAGYAVFVTPKRIGESKGYHGHLIEFGHRIVFIRKGRFITRKIDTGKKTRPRPFMRTAFDTEATKCYRIGISVLKNETLAETQRLLPGATVGV